MTVTTLYLDTDYVLDQVFWQYAPVVADRTSARDFARELFSEPTQVLRLGERQLDALLPALDELVAVTADRQSVARFFRIETLLFTAVDAVMPLVRITPMRMSRSQRQHSRPTLPRLRAFRPLRVEARTACDLLRGSIAEHWTLPELAGRVHLSPKQLSRVFVAGYGKTPLAYLTMLRVEAMGRLLRTTDLTVAAAGQQVGWDSRSRAAEAFEQCVGVTPQRYRILDADDGGR